jgi:hypothetical protein
MWLRKSIAEWLPILVLLVFTVLVGPSLGAAYRPIFVAACAAVAWHSWTTGVASHFQTCLVLFLFAPFCRRLIDVTAGYDPSSLMLVGPAAAILVPSYVLLLRHEPDDSFGGRMAPLLVVGSCVAYATVLAFLQDEWMRGITGALKWLAPLLYAAVLIRSGEASDILEAGRKVFLVCLPVMGLYGIYQYIDPPEWDRLWIQSATVTAGLPIPFGVRTFSTLNGPASFATFTAAGLLTVLILRPSVMASLLVAPAAVALLLSTYRTAWLSLAAGLLFCLIHRGGRRQASGVVLVMSVVLAVVITTTPFGEAITDRLATFAEGTGDGSAHERLEELVTLWNTPDSTVFGVGFVSDGLLGAGVMPVDGMIVACWLTMGIVVGILCLFGLLLAIGKAVLESLRRREDRHFAVLGALAVGALIQLPLANISSSELGFLFWTFTVLAFPAVQVSTLAEEPSSAERPTALPAE